MWGMIKRHPLIPLAGAGAIALIAYLVWFIRRHRAPSLHAADDYVKPVMREEHNEAPISRREERAMQQQAKIIKNEKMNSGTVRLGNAPQKNQNINSTYITKL